MALGLKGFAEDLIKQTDACRRTSPLYGALMGHLQQLWGGPREEWFHGMLEKAWEGRAFAVWYERPLLLALVLHDLALERGVAGSPLAEAFPSCGGSADRLSAGRVREAVTQIETSPRHLQMLRAGYVQTNETSRGVAWLWPLATLAQFLPAEMMLFDLGASAGLNLVADRMPPIWADGAGRPLRLNPLPDLIDRIGYDRAPIQVSDPFEVRRLRAAIWADDLQRLARLDHAIEAAREAHRTGELRVETADLLDVFPKIQSEVKRRGEAAVIFHSFATDYLQNDKRDHFERRMRDLILDLPERSIWIEFESARSTPGVRIASGAGPAELRIHWNQGGMLVQETLARAAAHPLTLQIDAKAVARVLESA